MALPTNRKLTLSDVRDNFKEYNFIISLKGMTIDTTEYVQAFHQTTQLVGISQATDGHLCLSDNERDLSREPVAQDENCVVLFDKSVEDIKVKSRRNFLLNQKTKA